ncbi:MAG: hypothetical protein WBA41_12370, partial [Rivularia sp. (in: cyanobacteria)]
MNQFLAKQIIFFSQFLLFTIILNLFVIVRPSLAQIKAISKSSNTLNLVAKKNLIGQTPTEQNQDTEQNTEDIIVPPKKIPEEQEIIIPPKKIPDNNQDNPSTPANPPTDNQNNRLEDITPTSETIPNRNYVGFGGNFGLNGDTALGENAFTVFSKIGLTNNLSFRPSVMVNDKA